MRCDFRTCSRKFAFSFGMTDQRICWPSAIARLFNVNY